MRQEGADSRAEHEKNGRPAPVVADPIQQKVKTYTLGGSLGMVMLVVGLAMAFNAGVWYLLGPQKALEFLGGYLIEFSLSIDNLFVFIMIFTAFGLSEHAQHRTLNYGIIGAIVMRFIFIFFGLKIIERFEWVLSVFGVLLIVSGLKMFAKRKEGKDPSDSKVIRALRKCIRMTPDYVGDKFFVKLEGKVHATPLFAVLVLVECSDVMFAIDSVPAIFSITTDLLIVYTSNVFAILGLRQLYFVLRHLYDRFRYIKYGVAVILVFVGVKLCVLFFDKHIPTEISIGFIAGALALSVIVSLIISGIKNRKEKKNV